MEQESILVNIIIWLFLIEIPVGVIQLIGALVRTIVKLNSNEPLGKLKKYWTIVGCYFLAHLILILFLKLLYIGDDFKAELVFTWVLILLLTLLAWLIAIWYCVKIVFTQKFISKIILKLKK